MLCVCPAGVVKDPTAILHASRRADAALVAVRVSSLLMSAELLRRVLYTLVRCCQPAKLFPIPFYLLLTEPPLELVSAPQRT